MKKYLFGVFALVLAIGFSAYTTSEYRFADRYFVYDGTGAHDAVTNYGAGLSTFSCPIPDLKLCAIIVNDDGDNVLEAGEMTTFKSTRTADGDADFLDEGETTFIKLKP
jgi:hypothetical protein